MYEIEKMIILADEYEDGMNAFLADLEAEADLADMAGDFPTEEALEEEGIEMGFLTYASWL